MTDTLRAIAESSIRLHKVHNAERSCRLLPGVKWCIKPSIYCVTCPCLQFFFHGDQYSSQDFFKNNDTFALLQTVHLEISKLLERCSYLACEALLTWSERAVCSSKTFFAQGKVILGACNDLILCLRDELSVSRLVLDFSKSEACSQLNGRFKNGGLKRLQGNTTIIWIWFPCLLMDKLTK